MEMVFNSVGIYTNSGHDSEYRMTREIAGFLKSECVFVWLVGDEKALSNGALGLPAAGVCDVSCVITLGGDGTLLHAAHSAAICGTPILGINLGRLGYLTDVSADGALSSLACLLSGEYMLERRLMLSANLENGTAIALNDAYVSRLVPPRPLMFSVEINGFLMDKYQADGILVSTPTGSTAYNLSAGGPVIKPDVDVLAITPVSPHALHVRSAVVASDDVVTISVLSGAGALYMDGILAGSIERGGKVTIRRSEYFTTIIKTKNQGFYDILREKMM